MELQEGTNNRLPGNDDLPAESEDTNASERHLTTNRRILIRILTVTLTIITPSKDLPNPFHREVPQKTPSDMDSSMKY